MKKGKLTTAILVLIFFAGLSLLLYPTVANYWNESHQARAISTYTQEVARLDDNDREQFIEEARQYNQKLISEPLPFALTAEQYAAYESVLNITSTGVMGYIEIPEIDVNLPIYHGTSDEVLQNAVGHLEWSALPVGGEGTHCVLSGHRGLPSAKLFTHLDKLIEGDVFIINVLDETLTYEVDQIRIVLPHELADLRSEKGKDLCTLMTCTPYGVNTHRLLVRGHRIENAKEALSTRVAADGIRIGPLIVSVSIIIPLLVVIVILVAAADFLRRGNKKKKGRDSHD